MSSYHAWNIGTWNVGTFPGLSVWLPIRMNMEARVLYREAVAGVTTFLTMAYVIFLNPAILSGAGSGIPFSGALTATVLISGLATILMGVYARLPYALAPGMGLNAFVAYTLIAGREIPWQVALGLVFWTGVAFLALSVTPVRALMIEATPPRLRGAAAAGIGVLLTFLGLKNAGLVAADPATLVRLGDIGMSTVLAMSGLAVICVMWDRYRPVAFLVSILAITGAAWLMGLARLPDRLLSRPDFSNAFLQLRPLEALQSSLIPAAITLLFTDLFDSLASFVGVAQAAGLVDREGNPLRLKKALIVDSVATIGSGLVGTSPATTYVESVAGISVGGRTGLTSVFAGLCFFPFLFVAPLAEAIPLFATSPVLVVVGLVMFRSNVASLQGALEEALPPFLIIILIPLTFSITAGLLWGFLAHAVLFLLAGRAREVKPTMYVLALLSILLIYVERGF